MANWFDRIKKYYDAGLWTKKMVGNAVVKKKITAEQYKETYREDYKSKSTGILTLAIGQQPGKECKWTVPSLVPSTKSFADGSRKKIVGRISALSCWRTICAS